MSNILIDILNNKSTDYKQRFLQMTDIELNECKPELFNNHRYIDKLYKNDIFIFCSNNGNIIGLSKGKDQRQFGYQNLIINYQKTPFTFNTLLNESPIIIRVPAKYLIYRPRYNKKWNREVVSMPLNKRLIIYKERKRSDTMTNVIKNIIISMTHHLYDKKIPKELLNVLNVQDKNVNMQIILDKAMGSIRVLNNNYIMIPKEKRTYIDDFYYKNKLFDLEKVLKKINWYIEI